MPTLTSSLPTYRKHRSSGQAVVTLGGRDHYLGPHGTRASRLKYDLLIGEWLANGRSAVRAQQAITLVELGAAYHKWATAYYVKDGKQTGRAAFIKLAMKRLCLDLGYARTLVVDFGPLALQAVQARLVETGRKGPKSRKTVNELVAAIKAAIRWGVAQELVPPSVTQALAAVPGLKVGRSAAKETPAVEPVDDKTVDATLPFLSDVSADMVRLHRLLGCRPGELCNLRPCDIDRKEDIWRFVPTTHKTEHHGHKRAIFIGPKAQAILAPYLLRDPDAWCFSPAESERKRRAEQRENRKSKVQPSQVDRARRSPKRRAGTRYTKDSYNRAVRRACEEAFPIPNELPEEQHAAWRKDNYWHPNQLRHSAATEIRAKFGIEAAQHVLGHSKADMTETYAKKNMEIARDVARQIG